MSRLPALCLALFCAALFAVSVPLASALFSLLLERIHSMGMFAYSTLLACVAVPFLYAMFRRLK